MPDIFISYSSHDRMLALELAEKLRTSGYDAWIDQHQIHGTMRWGKEIVQAINGSKLVAVLISSSSLLSENVMKELTLAAEKHKNLLPIMLEDTELTEEFAYHLAGLHRVAIEDSDSILKALEQLKLRTETQTPIRPYAQTPVSKDIRLAVLPFDDLSREHDNEWFADGMLDELITTLGALDNMKVPSRTDVMYYKKHHPRAQEIASDLNVRYLVGGSVRKAGNKVRITASLTDAFTNQQIWTSNYDGSFDNIFDMQESVSKQITDALKLKLTKTDKIKIEAQPTVNAEAYELYLRGLEQQRFITRVGYDKALEYYEKAISLDPYYADAYLSISSLCGAYYREYSKDPNWLLRAEGNLETAEKITGKTAKTLWAKGEIEWLKNDLVNAEKSLLQAIELDPKFQSSFNILGNIYIKQNELAKAAWAFEMTLQIQESINNYYNYLIVFSNLGKSEALRHMAIIAVHFIQKHLTKYPDDLFGKLVLSNAYFWADMNEDAKSLGSDLKNNFDKLDTRGLFHLGNLFDDLGENKYFLETMRMAIKKGFRQIELLEKEKFHCTEELEIITQELKEMIEKEDLK